MTHRGGRSLSTSLVVLFVLAIQGLTPDLHDLASANAFRVLFPSAAGENPPSGQDQLPPQICVSAERPASNESVTRRSEFARTTLAASHPACDGLTGHRRTSHDPGSRTPEDQAHRTSRLIC